MTDRPSGVNICSEVCFEPTSITLDFCLTNYEILLV